MCFWKSIPIGLSLIFFGLFVKAESTVASRADKYSSYFYKLTPSKELVSKVASTSAGAACSVGGCVGRNAASETQALFLMATLASIEGMKQQIEVSGIKKESVSLDQLSKVATESAGHLVQASETAGGLGAMFVTNKAMKVPLDAWNSVVMNSSARPILKELIATSSASLVGFIGFEAGAELMHRAIEMIPDEADRQKASKLISTMWNSFTTKDPNQSQDDKRVISAVFSNMYEILVQNSELREKWWSFVMRNRIQTGNFAVGVSMMSMGATIGGRVGACVPHPASKIASPIIGATFGVAGGVAASFVPRDTKDDITKGFQSVRMGLSTAQIQTSQINLREAVRKLENEEKLMTMLGDKRKGNDWKLKNIEVQVNDEIKKMDSAREDLMTSFYDRIHLLNSRLYNIKNKIQLAIEHQNPEAVKKLQQEYDEYFAAFQKSRSEIDKKLSDEVAYYEGLSKRTTVSGYKEKMKSQYEELKAMKQWTGRFLDQIQSTSSWSTKSTVGNQPSLMSEQDNQRLLEKLYMWGFKKTPFIETMEFNN